MDRILFLGHSGLKGGAEYCLDVTLRYLNREQYEPGVIFGTDGPMLNSAQNLGLWSETRPFSWWMLYERNLWQYKNRMKIPSRVMRLVQLIRRNKIRLVYTNTACIFEGAIAAWLAGVPHIWHIHEVLSPVYMTPRLLPLSWIGRTINRLSDRVIFESEASREIGSRWINPGKSLAIPNSVRFTDNAGFDSYSSRIKFGFRPNDIVILWGGRFSDRKNPLLLVEAVDKMKNRNGVKVVFVGDGPLKGQMEQEIENRQLGSIIHILPFQENIRSIMACADILTLTSVEESFGMVLVEAGTFRIPVVATRSQGPNEIIVDGKTGFVVRQNDAERLAQKLDRLAGDLPLRYKMGKAHYKRVMDEYNPEKNTRRIEAEIARLIAANPLPQ